MSPLGTVTSSHPSQGCHSLPSRLMGRRRLHRASLSLPGAGPSSHSNTGLLPSQLRPLGYHQWLPSFPQESSLASCSSFSPKDFQHLGCDCPVTSQWVLLHFWSGGVSQPPHSLLWWFGSQGEMSALRGASSTIQCPHPLPAHHPYPGSSLCVACSSDSNSPFPHLRVWKSRTRSALPTTKSPEMKGTIKSVFTEKKMEVLWSSPVLWWTQGLYSIWSEELDKVQIPGTSI